MPGEPHWTLVDTGTGQWDGGDALPLLPDVDLWRLLAVSGGRPVTVAGTLGFTGLRALSCAVPGTGGRTDAGVGAGNGKGWRWVPL